MGRNPLLGRLKMVLGRLVLYKSIKLLIFFGWSIAFLQFILFYTIVAHRFIASRCGSKESMAPSELLGANPSIKVHSFTRMGSFSAGNSFSKPDQHFCLTDPPRPLSAALKGLYPSVRCGQLLEVRANLFLKFHELCKQIVPFKTCCTICDLCKLLAYFFKEICR